MLNFIIVKLYNYARKDSLQTRFEIKFVVTIVLGGHCSFEGRDSFIKRIAQYKLTGSNEYIKNSVMS